MKRVMFYVFMSWILLPLEVVYAHNTLECLEIKIPDDLLSVSHGLDSNRIVFMGNSITQGWPDQSPSFFSDTSFLNKGVSGQTSAQMLARFPTDVLDLSPSIVVILSGTNDIAENQGPISMDSIVKNIAAMVDLARENNIEVILCSVLPVEKFPWRPALKPADKMIELNQRLQAYAKEENLVFVDYFTPMANNSNGLKEELGYDGVHPNAAGYAIMEPLILEAIKKVKQN